MKLGPHLYRIGNNIVAAYLVETEEGITVIDAGLPGHWRDFIAELKAMHRSIEDVRGLVLTHGDSDHIGFAEKLRKNHGVPVYVHASDATRACTGQKPKTPMGPARLGPMLKFFTYGMAKQAWRTNYLAEVKKIVDEDVLPLPGSPRVIGLPGHSPGSIALHIPIADAVFVGDALTTRHVLTGATGLLPPPFTDDPAQAIESLERLTGVEASWVLPGHGPPWRGNPAEVQDAVRRAAGPESASP